MPRHPVLSDDVSGIPSGVFSQLARHLAAHEGETYPFHVGDTWLEPPPGAWFDAPPTGRGLHLYTATKGHPVLLRALAERYSIDPAEIVVTAGATAAWNAVLGTVLDPGEEVLVLAPFWPLIRGLVRRNRGRAIEVPFYDREGTVDERLHGRLTDRTVAIYLNSPNNPTGCVLSEQELAAIADFARRHDLWIFTDEVYELYAFARPHLDIRRMAPERTIAAYSMSKAWGIAGHRVGYVFGPADVVGEIEKAVVHGFYHAPTAFQVAAADILARGEPWLRAAREAYQRAGQDAAATLGVAPPDGATFLFLDAAPVLDDRGLLGLLHDCLAKGVLVAPGTACGQDYATWVRVCFTAAPPDVTGRGLRILAGLLGR